MGERKPLKQPSRDFLFQETGFPHLRARIVTVNAVTGGSRSGPSSSSSAVPMSIQNRSRICLSSAPITTGGVVDSAALWCIKGPSGAGKTEIPDEWLP